MNAHKFWLKSKTILFNLMLTAAGAWTAIEGSMQNLRESISPKTYGLVLTAVGVIGVILRAKTSSSVTHKTPPKS